MKMGSSLAVLFAILFLIPGFIWQKISQASSVYSRPVKVNLLECLTLSCINYLLASPIVCLLLPHWPADLDPKDPGSVLNKLGYLYLAAWLSLVFILPVVGGVLTAKIPQWGWLNRSLGKVGITLLHPAPTAWDYAFARGHEYWARIELTNDELVEGIFGENSLASSEGSERDLFLESVYELDSDTGEYEAVEDNEGIYIRAGDIRTISFFTLRLEDAGGVKPGNKLE